MTARKSWIFTSECPDLGRRVFFRNSPADEKQQRRWFRRRYPEARLISVEDNWVNRVSEEVRAENGVAERMLCIVCNRMRMIRPAVILRFGDPRKWPRVDLPSN